MAVTLLLNTLNGTWVKAWVQKVLMLGARAEIRSELDESSIRVSMEMTSRTSVPTTPYVRVTRYIYAAFYHWVGSLTVNLMQSEHDLRHIQPCGCGAAGLFSEFKPTAPDHSPGVR